MSSQGDSQRPRPPVSRHDRRKQETRARIRTAAAELFAEQGYEATKVVEICERADVAHQTFFNHFPRKRDLLADLFSAGVDFLWATMDDACRRGRGTRERLALFFEGISQAAMDVGPLDRELVATIVGANEETLRLDESRRVSDAFLTLVARGLEDGDVTRRYEPEALAELVEGALTRLMLDWSSRPDFDIVGRRQQLAALVADALETRSDEGSGARGRQQ